MHATDVIGYVIDCDLICADCATEGERQTASPMFAGAEVGYPCHCERCGYLIDGISLTDEGRDYVANALARAKSRSDALDSWANLLSDSDPDAFHRAALANYRWVGALADVLNGQPLASIPGPLGVALRMADDAFADALDRAST